MPAAWAPACIIDSVNWKWKAFVQNSVALLPSDLSNALYYRLQRAAGGLRVANPRPLLEAGSAIVDRIKSHGGCVEGSRFLEIGTGRGLSVPIAAWLCGAGECVTVDLNHYLAPEVVFADIAYMKANETGVRNFFGDKQVEATFNERFKLLAALSSGAGIADLMELTGITYLAPADATKLPYGDASFDCHVSNNVLEHVPPETVASIFVEGRRVLRPGGMSVHRIDFSDHFMHVDQSITSVNFLQFSERDWKRYAGNRYMYHNRLRIDEFSAILDASGIQVLAWEPTVDDEARRLLSEGSLSLDTRFSGKPAEVNATSWAWLTAKVPDAVEATSSQMVMGR